jgi:hypothetical protein
MFHDSLQNEPHLGISFWEKECPVTKRIAFTIPGGQLGRLVIRYATARCSHQDNDCGSWDK